MWLLNLRVEQPHLFFVISISQDDKSGNNAKGYAFFRQIFDYVPLLLYLCISKREEQAIIISITSFRA
jgi:hypothetical protein